MMLLSACEDSDNKKFIGTWVTTAPTQEQITVIFNPNEWGFQYNITSDTLTFYKTEYSEEPWYCFKRQA